MMNTMTKVDIATMTKKTTKTKKEEDVESGDENGWTSQMDEDIDVCDEYHDRDEYEGRDRNDFYRELMAYDPIEIKHRIAMPAVDKGVIPPRERKFTVLKKESVKKVMIEPIPVVLEPIPIPVVLEPIPIPVVLEPIPIPVVLEPIPIPVVEMWGGCNHSKEVLTRVEEKKRHILEEKERIEKENRFVPDPEIAQRDPKYKVTPISKRYRVEVNYAVKTKICKFGGRCRYRETCVFAHNVSELTPVKCSFGCRCRDVTVRKGVVVNKSPDRVCYFQHAETVKQYVERVGVGVGVY
jgi:hypothetical protein